MINPVSERFWRMLCNGAGWGSMSWGIQRCWPCWIASSDSWWFGLLGSLSSSTAGDVPSARTAHEPRTAQGKDQLTHPPVVRQDHICIIPGQCLHWLVLNTWGHNPVIWNSRHMNNHRWVDPLFIFFNQRQSCKNKIFRLALKLWRVPDC